MERANVATTDMDVFLTWNPRIKDIDRYVKEATEAIKKSDLKLLGKESLEKLGNVDKCLVIILGGDGTVFRVAHKLVGSDVLFLPIKLGGVCFLSDYGIEDLEKALEKLKKRSYDVQELQVYQFNGGYFINDLVISTTQRTGVIHIDVDIKDYGSYKLRGDGVVISTRIGSSAYNLSSGGPILLEEGLVVTPIAPFTFSAPMVTNKEISLTVDAKNEAALAYDGVIGKLERRIEIKKGKYRIKVISFSKHLDRIKRLWHVKSQL